MFQIYNTAARKYLAIADGKNGVFTEVSGLDLDDPSDVDWEIRSVGGYAWT
jgi:hypothetical protein